MYSTKRPHGFKELLVSAFFGFKPWKFVDNIKLKLDRYTRIKLKGNVLVRIISCITTGFRNYSNVVDTFTPDLCDHYETVNSFLFF